MIQQPTFPISVPASFARAAAGDPRLSQLVQGTYFRAARLTDGAGQYLDYNLRFSSTPTSWSLQQGIYNQYPGYWIFRTDVNQCWQAQNTNGPLVYWNKDGLAHWPPQDWELFRFEFADTGQYVVAKNIYGTNYLRQQGINFGCDGTYGNAVRFGVEF